ncbi:MAG: dephospho-CoA kinase [Hydrogenophaga sp.]|uniref:dephospho-CoA kinase n=1 Tax=Hydrogenophaga sp. TaxID=1904254 RepID=UPI001D24EEF0|nr:dephospho-CoA kinase [Hydrogenophaga sp.]MBX3611712.1 dephospho-CoA kinase [Hydrogenophaga sp.]
MSLSRPWRVGLTGGIGSGKSTVAARWRERGANVIDADAISRESTAAGGIAIQAIRESFGDRFINEQGALDRGRMRELVFADPTSRQRLESIIHPLVAAAVDAKAAASRSPCILFDVPLLVESPRWRHRLDRVVVVDCSEATQLRRVRARSGWSDDTILSVMREQASRTRRVGAADAVIDNDADELDRLHRLVDRLSSRFGL